MEDVSLFLTLSRDDVDDTKARPDISTITNARSSMQGVSASNPGQGLFDCLSVGLEMGDAVGYLFSFSVLFLFFFASFYLLSFLAGISLDYIGRD